jgi:transcriptional regulator with XRE-family HTH domain
LPVFLDISFSGCYDGSVAPQYNVEAPNEVLRINLLVLRAQKGLSQAALARRAGVSRAIISELEQGRGDVRLTTLARLARALDSVVRDLLEPWRPQRATEEELSRRARDDEFIEADAFLDALDDADSVPRYSRRGRRAAKTTKSKRAA